MLLDHKLAEKTWLQESYEAHVCAGIVTRSGKLTRRYGGRARKPSDLNDDYQGAAAAAPHPISGCGEVRPISLCGLRQLGVEVLAQLGSHGCEIEFGRIEFL